MEVVTDLKTQLVQSTEDLIKKVENANMDITTLGKGPNKVIIFNNPIQVEEPVKYIDDKTQPSQIDRYVVVSPQFGIGKIDFVTKTQVTEGGKWEIVATVDRESQFKKLTEKYSAEKDGSIRSGIHQSESKGSEFLLHVGGEAFRVDADLDAESLAQAKDLNVLKAPKVKPSVQILTNRVSAVSQASNLF